MSTDIARGERARARRKAKHYLHEMQKAYLDVHNYVVVSDLSIASRRAIDVRLNRIMEARSEIADIINQDQPERNPS